MIGKKITVGTGGVLVGFFENNFILCKTREVHQPGEWRTKKRTYLLEKELLESPDLELIIKFLNVKSLDVFIGALKALKRKFQTDKENDNHSA